MTHGAIYFTHGLILGAFLASFFWLMGKWASK